MIVIVVVFPLGIVNNLSAVKNYYVFIKL